mgnify:CR=1 FL=1
MLNFWIQFFFCQYDLVIHQDGSLWCFDHRNCWSFIFIQKVHLCLLIYLLVRFKVLYFDKKVYDHIWSVPNMVQHDHGVKFNEGVSSNSLPSQARTFYIVVWPFQVTSLNKYAQFCHPFVSTLINCTND